MSKPEPFWKCLRDGSREEIGENVEDEDDLLTDENMKLGAILRIADALERISPPTDQREERRRRERESKDHAMQAFLKSTGYDPYLRTTDIGISEAVATKLEENFDKFDNCHECVCSLVCADEIDLKIYFKLTAGEIEKVKTALAAHGWCLDDDDM